MKQVDLAHLNDMCQMFEKHAQTQPPAMAPSQAIPQGKVQSPNKTQNQGLQAIVQKQLQGLLTTHKIIDGQSPTKLNYNTLTLAGIQRQFERGLYGAEELPKLQASLKHDVDIIINTLNNPNMITD